MNRVIINFKDGMFDDEELAVVRGSHMAWRYNREFPCHGVIVHFKSKNKAVCTSTKPKGRMTFAVDDDGRLQRIK